MCNGLTAPWRRQMQLNGKEKTTTISCEEWKSVSVPVVVNRSRRGDKGLCQFRSGGDIGMEEAGDRWNGDAINLIRRQAKREERSPAWRQTRVSPLTAMASLAAQLQPEDPCKQKCVVSGPIALIHNTLVYECARDF
uniref:Uncharacterized protein n=1 Tax=Panagrellus redivivus TaxID=6233 RepID=A0A7E4USX1_PANRE